LQNTDAFVKANPGYKVCPTRKQPAKPQTAPVTKRRKPWAFAADAAKYVPSLRKVTEREEMPQRHFSVAGEISIHVPQT